MGMMGLHVVNQSEGLLVFRGGKFLGVRLPGFHFVVPIIFQCKKVYLRDALQEVARRRRVMVGEVSLQDLTHLDEVEWLQLHEQWKLERQRKREGV